jgi:hypothetical protein
MDATTPAVEDDDEIWLLVPPRACHLRAIRLVAAEAGRRAGFDMSELDDLRIAVGELCSVLMDATERRLLVKVLVRAGRVVVRGSAPRRDGGAPPSLPGVSELIVDAVSDDYALEVAGTQLSFVVWKEAAAA